jgi:hypothetical protein
VAAVGLAAALLGTQGDFIVYHLLDDVTGSVPVSEEFFGMPLVSRWVPLAIGATLAIALVASLFGATLASLAGSLFAAGGIAVLPLPMMQAVGGLGYDSTFGLGMGYYVMIAGCAVAAIGSAADVRRRPARVLPPGD